jgi:exosortase/archaeosortase family protein
MLLVFIAVTLALHLAWAQARGSWVEHFVVDDTTVHTAAVLINWLSPEIGAHADGSHIRAAGGGINVLNGCEGVDVLILLLAALSSVPMTWRSRAVGLVVGTLCVFALNEARLLALFYSFRQNRVLFDQLHGFIAPLLMVAGTLGLFMLLLGRDPRMAMAAEQQPLSE